MDLPPVHSRDSNGTALYEKSCSSCGKVSIVDKRRLNKPCHPCAMKLRITHGLAVGGRIHPLYMLLNGIRNRCRYHSLTNYKYYGGRGISVCREWLDNPLAFAEWATAHGWRKGLDIDRIDTNGNYTPENCRIITHRENSQRTRRIQSTTEQIANVKKLLSAGATVKAAAIQAGVTYMTAWHVKNTPGVWSNVVVGERAHE